MRRQREQMKGRGDLAGQGARHAARFAAGLAAAALLFVGAMAALAENDPDARFRGGSYDGHDLDTLNQSATDWPVFAALLAARGRGGSYDGSAMAETVGATLPALGTLILIR